nr:protein BIG GRAIN 1-like A isoform X2 [Nicotiana tomentosiformis]
MDKYNYYPRDSCSPSFSSTILDSIYHSIDQTHDHQKHYKASEKVVVRRKSAADSEKNSGSSNCGSSACFNGLNNRPKPIRTSISADQENFHKHQYCPKHLNFYDFSLAKEKTKHQEDGFVKTKSRALKIYRNLKKVKQPISPGVAGNKEGWKWGLMNTMIGERKKKMKEILIKEGLLVSKAHDTKSKK